jgi:protein phosphatase
MRPAALALSGEIVRVQVAGQSHTGRVRSRNEDHFIAARLGRTMEVLESNLAAGEVPPSAQLDGYILAVADGVGGHNAGERASSLVIARGIELILASANWGVKLEGPEAARLIERMREYLDHLNDSVRAAVEADEALAGMATTLTVAYTVGLRAFIVHVGDSRAYVFREGRLIQLTRDHTVAQELADIGEISREAIRRHPRRNTLTNVIGGAGFQRPDNSHHQLQPDDVLLLCTDGLSDLIDADEISALIEAHPWPAQLCPALIDAALAAGGKDNVTCVAARYTLDAD